MATNSRSAEVSNDEDSFLDIDLNDIPEMRILDEGEEALLVIDRAQKGTSKAGEPYVMVFLSHSQDPTVKTFSQYYGLGKSDEDPKSKQSKLDRFRNFVRDIGVDFSSGLDLNEFAGKEIWAIVKVTENEEYGAQNAVKTFLKGKR